MAGALLAVISLEYSTKHAVRLFLYSVRGAGAHPRALRKMQTKNDMIGRPALTSSSGGTIGQSTLLDFIKSFPQYREKPPLDTSTSPSPTTYLIKIRNDRY